MIDMNSIYGFLAGIVVASLAVAAFIRNRLSPSEVQDIYDKTTKAINSYREAKADGQLTPDETIKLAEETLDAINTFVKDLKS